jgi:hypothetical protein
VSGSNGRTVDAGAAAIDAVAAGDCAFVGIWTGAKEPFLRGFLKLTNGPPSHDTFSRLFRRECPENGGMTTQRVRSVGSIADRGNGDAMGVAVDCDRG